MFFRAQIRGDAARALGTPETVNYDMAIVLRRASGDSVVLGRNLHVVISETGGLAADSLNVRVFHSADDGASFIDRGTVDVVNPGSTFATVIPVVGTHMRIQVQAPSGGTLSSVIYLS